jgi:hypothetical protein
MAWLPEHERASAARTCARLLLLQQLLHAKQRGVADELVSVIVSAHAAEAGLPFLLLLLYACRRPAMRMGPPAVAMRRGCMACGSCPVRRSCSRIRLV